VPIPRPEPGLVISYSYLWKREARSGQDEGLKDRPCAIIVAQQVEGGGRTRILVAPISHQPSADPAMCMEIPARVKQMLGLDGARSWVHFEVNRFWWPGPDLRPVSRARPDLFEFGFLPPKLFGQLTKRIAALAVERRLIVTARSEAIHKPSPSR
jgi:hypothetical protein